MLVAKMQWVNNLTLAERGTYQEIPGAFNKIKQLPNLHVVVATTTSGITTYVVNKYSNTNNITDKDDIKVLRYSDVLLIFAEAYARTNDETNPRLRLNQLAQNREPAFVGYASSG